MLHLYPTVNARTLRDSESRSPVPIPLRHSMSAFIITPALPSHPRIRARTRTVRLCDEPPRRARRRVPSANAPKSVPRPVGVKGCTVCGGSGAVDCEPCDKLGFILVTEGVWGTCEECRGSGLVECDVCARATR